MSGQIHARLNPRNLPDVRQMIVDLLTKGEARPIDEADLIFTGDK